MLHQIQLVMALLALNPTQQSAATGAVAAESAPEAQAPASFYPLLGIEQTGVAGKTLRLADSTGVDPIAAAMLNDTRYFSIRLSPEVRDLYLALQNSELSVLEYEDLVDKIESSLRSHQPIASRVAASLKMLAASSTIVLRLPSQFTYGGDGTYMYALGDTRFAAAKHNLKQLCSLASGPGWVLSLRGSAPTVVVDEDPFGANKACLVAITGFSRELARRIEAAADGAYVEIWMTSVRDDGPLSLMGYERNISSDWGFSDLHAKGGAGVSHEFDGHEFCRFRVQSLRPKSVSFRAFDKDGEVLWQADCGAAKCALSSPPAPPEREETEAVP